MGLIIVGNSGAARECYWLFQAMRANNPSWPPFKGFLAWRGYPGKLHELASLELGSSDTYQPVQGDLFAIGIGYPVLRKEIFAFYSGLGVDFLTLCHPSVWICPSAQIGIANVFHNGCHIGPNSKIGDCNYLNGSIVVGHDAALGCCNVLNVFSLLGGEASMGDCNQLGPACQLLPKAKMGSHNILAPASVLHKGCRDTCVLAGNPALVVEKRKIS